MSQSDFVPWGKPAASKPGRSSFGARAVGQIGLPRGVRIILKGFELIETDDGPVAHVQIQRRGAVQAVQALRQAIDDAQHARNLQ